MGISDAAESIGFRTLGVKTDFEQLSRETPLPCILHWNQNHFVVCYGIKKTQKGEYKIKISDPARDKIVISEDDFLKHWLSTKVDGKNIGTIKYFV